MHMLSWLRLAVSQQPPEPESREEADAEHGGGDACSEQDIRSLARGRFNGGWAIRIRREIAGAR